MNVSKIRISSPQRYLLQHIVIYQNVRTEIVCSSNYPDAVFVCSDSCQRHTAWFHMIISHDQVSGESSARCLPEGSTTNRKDQTICSAFFQQPSGYNSGWTPSPSPVPPKGSAVQRYWTCCGLCWELAHVDTYMRSHVTGSMTTNMAG